MVFVLQWKLDEKQGENQVTWEKTDQERPFFSAEGYWACSKTNSKAVSTSSREISQDLACLLKSFH